MVLSASVRAQMLAQAKAKGPSVGSQPLYYENETKLYDVYRLDLDHLIFNEHNGRLEAEMLTWKQEHSVGDDYDDQINDVIAEFLWKSNTAKNKSTLEDLEKKKQQRPGIVSADGVIIDGNRRAMLLRRLEKQKDTKQYFNAIILPHAYADNVQGIVRLETQYQLGEDAIVGYGAIQKYLHARRLKVDHGINEDEIDVLMGEPKGTAIKLLGIMKLMDNYLEHIGCPKLYTMLSDESGTKEGMFVDLYSDLKKFRGPNHKTEWQLDELDLLELETIQFDYIRSGWEASTDGKSYRTISHGGKQKNFFQREQIWKEFVQRHRTAVDPVTASMGTLEEFIALNPSDYTSKSQAARERDRDWREKTAPSMQTNYLVAQEQLYFEVNERAPRENLTSAKLALGKISLSDGSLTLDPANAKLVDEIVDLIDKMKQLFKPQASNDSKSV